MPTCHGPSHLLSTPAALTTPRRPSTVWVWWPVTVLRAHRPARDFNLITCWKPDSTCWGHGRESNSRPTELPRGAGLTPTPYRASQRDEPMPFRTSQPGSNCTVAPRSLDHWATEAGCAYHLPKQTSLSHLSFTATLLPSVIVILFACHWTEFAADLVHWRVPDKLNCSSCYSAIKAVTLYLRLLM